MEFIFDKICRCCLRSDVKAFCIFEKEATKEVSLAEKIYFITQIKILETNSALLWICENCKNKVNEFYEFRLKIIESDKIIQKWNAGDLRETRLKLNKSKADLQSLRDELHQSDVFDMPEITWAVLEEKSESDIPLRVLLQDYISKTDIHEKLNQDGPRQKCDLCFKAFDVPFALYKHILAHFYKFQGKVIEEETTNNTVAKFKQLTYQCKKCSIQFKNYVFLQSHLNTKHCAGLGTNYCQTCVRYFRKPQKFIVHLRGHFNIKPYQCNKCPAKMMSLDSYRWHFGNKHRNSAKISSSGNDKGKLMEKMDVDHNNKMDVLGKAAKLDGDETITIDWSNSPRLANLLKFYIKMTSDEIVCDVCLKSFASTELACSHLLGHFKKFQSTKLIYDELDFKKHCRYCIEQFDSTSLPVHMNEVHSGCEKYTCVPCNQTYFDKGTFKNHLMTEHVTYRCEICSAAFDNYVFLQDHINTHFIDRFYCQSCDKSFQRKPKFIGHLRGHFGLRPFRCSSCLTDFQTLVGLKDHQCPNELSNVKSRLMSDDETGKPLRVSLALDQSCLKMFLINMEKKCMVCLEEFQTVEHIVEHLENFYFNEFTRTNLIPLNCTVCWNEFKDFGALMMHLKDVENIYHFNCQICNEIIVNDEAALTHFRFSHNNYECKRCHENFESFLTFYKHLVRDHISRFYCVNCDKTYDRASFITHLRLHSNIKPCRCRFCPRRSYSTYIMKKHEQRMHALKQKRFICKTCGKPYLTSTELRGHEISLHLNHSMFKCKSCSKEFRTSTGLNTHMRLHNTDNLYICKHCGKIYINTSALKRHENLHSGEKNYACSTCNKAWYTISELNKHLRKKCQKVGEERPKMLRKNNSITKSHMHKDQVMELTHEGVVQPLDPIFKRELQHADVDEKFIISDMEEIRTADDASPGFSNEGNMVYVHGGVKYMSVPSSSISGTQFQSTHDDHIIIHDLKNNIGSPHPHYEVIATENSDQQVVQYEEYIVAQDEEGHKQLQAVTNTLFSADDIVNSSNPILMMEDQDGEVTSYVKTEDCTPVKIIGMWRH